MPYYLKEYPDGGWEYHAMKADSKPDQERLDDGFIIVDEIPQGIKDKEPGGKDYVEPKDERDLKIERLEKRISDLEKTVDKA